MKFKGWVMSAGLAATAATTAMADPLPAGGAARPPVTSVSDIQGSYAAMPPPLRRETRHAAPPVDALDVLSPDAVTRAARAEGFAPLGYPRQRGLVYTMAVINPDGDDGRLVIDARTGRLIRFMPAWQMGDRMEEVTVASYGRIQGLPRFIERNPPRPPKPVARVAARNPATPLPRPSPQHPAGEKAAKAAGADAAKDGSKPVLDQAKQDGARAPKQDTATVQTSPAVTPSAAGPAPAQAKSSATILPTEPLPPVQTLE
ncbi:hypothetical protein DU475_00375 [Rhodopseudomonas sp. WA056]|uniref:hypothetical protein n=1 Tax=Rhodopseudomonas sp. WA056 TaxID=2269367 RepID=UPI0013E06B77|nr:hypothetical protein [Rhodopseudomonas sp. WA056]NEW85718.1 hypothetical protein [Rhodopseudomonas sp. WA056]